MVKWTQNVKHFPWHFPWWWLTFHEVIAESHCYSSQYCYNRSKHCLWLCRWWDKHYQEKKLADRPDIPTQKMLFLVLCSTIVEQSTLQWTHMRSHSLYMTTETLLEYHYINISVKLLVLWRKKNSTHIKIHVSYIVCSVFSVVSCAYSAEIACSYSTVYCLNVREKYVW